MAVAICAALDRFTGAGKSKWIGSTSAATRKPSFHQCSHRNPRSLPSSVRRRRRHRTAARRRAIAWSCASISTNSSAGGGLLHRQAPPARHQQWEVFKAQIGGKRAVQNSLERISEVAQEMRVGSRNPTGRKPAASCARNGPSASETCPPSRRRPATASSKTPAATAPCGQSCGAGGGGCVVLLVDQTPANAWKRHHESGGQVLPMTIDRQGVQVVSRLSFGDNASPIAHFRPIRGRKGVRPVLCEALFSGLGAS